MQKEWLISTKYQKGDKSGQILVFFNEETGKITEIPQGEKHYSYFYTVLTEEQLLKVKRMLNEGYVKSNPKDERVWNRARIVKVERVKKIHPRSREEIELTKVSVKSPHMVTNPKDTGMSQLISEEFVYNNHVPYADVFNFDNNLTIGMPYDLETLEPMLDWEKIKSHPIYTLPEIDKYRGRIPKEGYDWLMSIFTTPFPDFKDHILAIDIECDFNYRDAIDAAEAVAPVSSVTLSWYKGDEIIHLTFILSDFARVREDSGFNLKHDYHIIREFNTEQELLSECLKYLSAMPQKFVIGFMVDNFDVPYLCSRMKYMGINTEKIWGYKKKKQYGKETFSKGIKNKFLLDLYSFFSNPSIKNYAFKSKYKNNSLDSISEALLGERKHIYENRITDLSMNELAYYNAKDNALVLKLCTFDNQIALQLIVITMRLGTMTIESACRRYVSGVLLNLTRRILGYYNMININRHELKQIGTTHSASTTGKKFAGAVVLDPIIGTHFNLLVSDIASLYPSMIVNKNICYTTMNCNHKECQKNKVYVTSFEAIDSLSVDEELPTHHICTKALGITSTMVGFIKDVRVYYFKRHKQDTTGFKAVEQYLKVILNASYGVYGFDRFAFFCGPAAEATTAFSRQTTMAIKEKFEQEKATVIAGDTDSVFLTNINNQTYEKIVTVVKEEYDVELEVEERGILIVLVGKKNYMIIEPKEDGSRDIIIAGLVGKKKHVPKLIQKAFTKWTEIIRDSVTTRKDLPLLIETLESSRKAFEMDIKQRKGDVEDYKISVTLSKTLHNYETNLPYVRAARNLVEAVRKSSIHPIDENLLIREGTIIEYIYTVRQTPKQTTKEVLPIELCTIGDIDPFEYIGILNNVFDQIVDPIKSSIKERKVKQTKLTIGETRIAIERR